MHDMEFAAYHAYFLLKPIFIAIDGSYTKDVRHTLIYI